MTDGHNHHGYRDRISKSAARCSRSPDSALRLSAFGPSNAVSRELYGIYYTPDETSIPGHQSVRMKPGSAPSKTIRASERTHDQCPTRLGIMWPSAVYDLCARRARCPLAASNGRAFALPPNTGSAGSLLYSRSASCASSIPNAAEQSFGMGGAQKQSRHVLQRGRFAKAQGQAL
jgi:hypothetical protein